MKNNLLILLFTLSAYLFVGCSSAPVQEDSEEDVSPKKSAMETSKKNKKGSSVNAEGEGDEFAAPVAAAPMPPPPLPPPPKAPAIKPPEPPKQEMKPKEIVKEAPKFDPIYQPLADAIKNQDDESMKSAALNILLTNSTDTKAMNALAYYYMRRKQFDVARIIYSKAIKAQPSNFSLVNNMAVVDLNAGEAKDALAGFKKAMELNSSDANVAANLGTLSLINRDLAKALYYLDQAYQKGQKTPTLLNNYGIALAGSGRAQQAKTVYEEGLALKDSSKELLFNYVVLLVDQLNMNKEAMDSINKLNALGVPAEGRNRWNNLENKARSGLK
jgi:tetratricopeptide (TPR) repeat protein